MKLSQGTAWDTCARIACTSPNGGAQQDASVLAVATLDRHTVKHWQVCLFCSEEQVRWTSLGYKPTCMSEADAVGAQSLRDAVHAASSKLCKLWASCEQTSISISVFRIRSTQSGHVSATLHSCLMLPDCSQMPQAYRLLICRYWRLEAGPLPGTPACSPKCVCTCEGAQHA